MMQAAIKPQSRLFKATSDEAYDDAFRRLQEAREEWPNYRDDELLMWLLSGAASSEVKK